jgi:P27 family predicted phage terminase small subunit
LSPTARAEFKRAVQLLEQRKTITPGDFTTLAVYAEVFARWIQAKREIGDSLMIETTVTDNNGNPRIVSRLNPLLKVAQACEARMLSLVKALGLTPVDREKARPTTGVAKDEIVPGSIADVMPELLNSKAPEPFIIMPPPPTFDEEEDAPMTREDGGTK